MMTEYILNGVEITVPACPANEDVEAAKDMLDGFLQGFPFASEVDRVHALAMAINVATPEFFPNLRPLFLITSDAPGQGKSVLADMLTWLATGEWLPKYAEPRSYAGWLRIVRSVLEERLPVAVFDNVTKMRDAAIEMIATSETIALRPLRKRVYVKYFNRTAWIFVGNRVSISDELARRTLRIRLSGHPTGHVRFHDWLTPAYRKDLLWSILVLHQRAENRPFPDFSTVPVLGSYEHWSQKMSHLLLSAGIEGFLGHNLQMGRFRFE